MTWAKQVFSEMNEVPGVKPDPDRYQMALQIPQGVNELHRLFAQAGYNLEPVGGSIRNTARNRPVKDFDLTTNAPTEESIRILRAAGYRPDLTGQSFGVVRVRAGTPPEEFEIASYRQDLTLGRKPETAYVDQRHLDAQRRDFTINAMYYDIGKGEVMDHVGGWDDLQRGIVRAVGNPWDRFNEDPLRVLRFLRFHNDIGGGSVDSIVDDDHREALKHYVQNGLRSTISSQSQVPPERIADEFVKGLKQAQSLPTYLRSANELGILPMLVFPGLNIDLNNIPTGIPKDYTTLIPLFASILGHNNPTKVLGTLRERKYENMITEGVSFLIEVTPSLGAGREAKLDRATIASNPNGFLGILARYAKSNSTVRRSVPSHVLFAWARQNGMDEELVTKFANYQWQPLSAFADPNTLPMGPQRGAMEKEGNWKAFLASLNSAE